MNKQFDLLFKQLQNEVPLELSTYLPYRSGELAASVKLQQNIDGFSVLITAPHTVYVEEPWLSPRWGGRENPNERVILEYTDLLVRNITQKLGGVYDIRK